jgi:uncharacterized membrane protein YgcG
MLEGVASLKRACASAIGIRSNLIPRCSYMKCRLLFLFIAFVLHLPAQEVPSRERPADHVLDETRKVTPAERKAVETEMELAATKAGLGIYLVLLNSGAEEPPADVAQRLAQAWTGNADRVVILTAPDISPPLVVAVSGESLGALPQADAQRLTETAVAAGQRAAPGLTAMLEAARSVVAQVEAFRKTGVVGTLPAPPAVEPAVEPGQPGRHLVAWIAGGSLACCLVALLLMRKGRRSALIFPAAEFRRRFSAPHTGGNDAMVHFGK